MVLKFATEQNIDFGHIVWRLNGSVDCGLWRLNGSVEYGLRHLNGNVDYGPGPAAQVQSRGQNRLWTLRYTPEEAISEKILKFRSHSSDICQY